MAVCIAAEICKGCGICVATCKQGVLRISGRRNRKGANVVEAGEPEQCVACRTCEITCPDLAVWIEPNETAAD